MSPEEIQQSVLAALEDAKAQNVKSIDVRDITDITDYMVIASGTSSRHVKSVADKAASVLRDAGQKPLGREGEDTGEWILIDFQPAIREHYQLEKLWEHGTAAERVGRPAE